MRGKIVINIGLVILLLLLVSINGYCIKKDNKGKDKKEEGNNSEIRKLNEFEKLGIWGLYKDPNYKFSCDVSVSSKKKLINFTDVHDGYEGSKGIKYATYKIDFDKKQISFYKKNGWLIITIEFLDNKRFRIIDYADWLTVRRIDPNTKDEVEKEIIDNERGVIHRFREGDYDDKERIYARPGY